MADLDKIEILPSRMLDVEELVKWVTKNNQVDPMSTPMMSPFGVVHVISVTSLLDHIHEITNIPKEVIGEWVDEAND